MLNILLLFPLQALIIKCFDNHILNNLSIQPLIYFKVKRVSVSRCSSASQEYLFKSSLDSKWI